MKFKKVIGAEVEVEIQLPAYFKNPGHEYFHKVISEKESWSISFYKDGSFHLTHSDLKFNVNEILQHEQISEQRWQEACLILKEKAFEFSEVNNIPTREQAIPETTSKDWYFDITNELPIETNMNQKVLSEDL